VTSEVRQHIRHHRNIRVRAIRTKDRQREFGYVRGQACLVERSSMHKGVAWDSARRKWKAQIYHNHRTYYIGRYDDEMQAVEERKRMERVIAEAGVTDITDNLMHSPRVSVIETVTDVINSRMPPLPQ
jgi:hypothetical protein